MRVTIPACQQHGGLYSITAEIADTCPRCGGPRGVVHGGFSFDGSRRLNVSRWGNPCGHVDYYADVRAEIAQSRSAEQMAADALGQVTITSPIERNIAGTPRCPECGVFHGPVDEAPLTLGKILHRRKTQQ